MFRCEITPEQIVGLNGSEFVMTEDGIDLKSHVNIIEFDNCYTTMKFMWYCSYLIEKSTAHDLLCHSELFLMGGLPHDTKNNTVVYWPADQNAMGGAFARLKYGFDLGQHLQINEDACSSQNMNKQLAALKELHKLTFDKDTGESKVGCLPPYDNLITMNDVDIHPFMAMNRMSIENKHFRATPAQRTRYYKYDQSRYFSNQMVRWSGRNDTLHSLPLAWSRIFDMDKVENETDLLPHAKSIKYMRSMKFTHKFRLCNNPSGSLKLSTDYTRLYSRLCCKDEVFDRSEMVALIMNDLLQPLGGSIQNYVSSEVKTVAEKHVAEAFNSGRGGDLVNDAVEQKMNNFALKTDIAGLETKVDQNHKLQMGKLSSVATSVFENKNKIAHNANHATFNTSLLHACKPSLGRKIAAIKQIVRPVRTLKSDAESLIAGKKKIEQFRKAANSTSIVCADSIPEPSQDISEKVDFNSAPLIPLVPAGIQFNIGNKKFVPKDQILDDLPDDNLVPCQPVTDSSYTSLASDIEQQRTDVRNYRERVTGSSDVDSSDLSINQEISRDEIAAPNVAHNRVIGTIFKPNFYERRDAFKRKYAYELVLSPYLYNLYRCIFIIFNYEFEFIIDKIIASKPIFHTMKGFHSEAKMIKEQSRTCIINDKTIIEFLVDSKDFNLPFITIQLLLFILEIFKSNGYIIPYVDNANFKEFLKRFFMKILPKDSEFLLKLSAPHDFYKNTFKHIDFISQNTSFDSARSATRLAFANLTLNEFSFNSDFSLS